MAQKQFKIGLSNTDKQNMAQDVYERVLALTFNEYDTTTEYDVGDFVVYNDQLYKCISATSGAWDSSKWQLATLNDLVDDIENAVAFVNDKANVNGNYPTMTVGFADNMTPYDESSGDDQDEPFSLQATGTGNGTQPDFATGSGALMKEKQGNTVVVNQLFRIDYNSSDFPYTYTNGVFSYNGTPTDDKYIINSPTIISAHKYLVVGYTNSSSDGFYTYIVENHGFGSFNININGTKIVTATSSYSGTGTYAFRAKADASCSVSFVPLFIDLTQWFNGDIPADLLAHPENFFRYYQGSLAYNEGTLVNSNGRYVKCIGRNQWDEETEAGNYNTTTGEKQSGAGLRCKNPIRVIPNTTYYCKSTDACWTMLYDKDGNVIATPNIVDVVRQYNNASNITGQTFTIPANCCYIAFYLPNSYGASYKHDTTISIYYDDESGYDQYYPYEELTNNDTGTETLRSAGSVADIKLPSGEIKRNVGTVTFVGASGENWDRATTSDVPTKGYYFYISVAGVPNVPNGSTKANALCNLFKVYDANHVYGGGQDEEGYVSFWTSNSRICVYSKTLKDMTTADFKTWLSTHNLSVNYELAEPTTEQGTPYSENVEIDDFGSMSFEGTNGVPQGANIFYPVDYKAFIDTLYKYTDGTPSGIALKSDLARNKSELQGVDTQLLNAIGGTLRKCLCVKETLDFENTDFVDLGDLSWYYIGNGAFSATNVGVKAVANDAVLKALSTKYQVVTFNTLNGDATKICMSGYVGSDSRIYVRDTTYTDADQFKNAMKGVLLAYEKASE